MLIILDRDGVINENRSDYVKTVGELVLFQRSIEAINCLLTKGYAVCVASNQAGVGKKIISHKDIVAIEEEINSKLVRPIDFYYCFHKAEDRCECRKPKSGLLERIITDHGSNPEIFIGDNITDYYAAEKIKVNFALVRTGMGSQFLNLLPRHVPIFDDLLCYVETAKDAKQ